MTERPSLLSTIPTTVLSAARDQRVTLIGMAAGPSFVARREEKFAPALPIAEAVQRLEQYRSMMRVARVELEDGTTWMFNHDGFRSVKAASHG